MKNCAEYIVEAMNYMDREIDKVDDNSVDKLRLRRSLNRTLVIKVKRLVELSQEESDSALAHIFREQLREEILRSWNVQ